MQSPQTRVLARLPVGKHSARGPGESHATPLSQEPRASALSTDPHRELDREETAHCLPQQLGGPRLVENAYLLQQRLANGTV